MVRARPMSVAMMTTMVILVWLLMISGSAAWAAWPGVMQMPAEVPAALSVVAMHWVPLSCWVCWVETSKVSISTKPLKSGLAADVS